MSTQSRRRLRNKLRRVILRQAEALGGEVVVGPEGDVAGWVKCAVCSAPVDLVKRRGDMKLSLDHITPKFAGGTNDDNNLQVTHAACNNERTRHVAPRGHNCPWCGKFVPKGESHGHRYVVS